jgi:translation initiation factor 1
MTPGPHGDRRAKLITLCGTVGTAGRVKSKAMRDLSLCGGLPPEICEQLSAEEQIIKIRVEKRRFGREVTIIEGINDKEFDLRKLASTLKSRLATGGTAKEGRIELQGDHRHRVKKILVELGFPEENITIIE